MNDSVVDKIKDALESILNDRKKLVKILSVMLILVVAAVLKIHDSSKADITIESAETAQETDTEEVYEDSQIIYVDIGGAVVNPGVYQVTKDTRLYEVIDMAGGLKDDADMDSVNRAAFVEDCQKIVIPVKGSSGNGDGDGDASSVTASSGITSEGLVNINTATLDELKTLNGIGDVIAERIIEYRSSNAFKSKEDVMLVNGIGKAIYEKIKDRIIC